MIEKLNEFENPENDIAKIFKNIGIKREEEEVNREKPIDEQLKKLSDDKRIPDLAMSEINSIIEEFRKKDKEIITEFIEFSKKNGIELGVINKQVKFLENKFEDKLKKFGIYYIDAAELLYTDERFDIANYNFFRKTLYKSIDNIFAGKNNDSVESINKTAIMFLDVDGLKAVNDLGKNKHADGDKLLELTVDILENGKTKKWLDSLGLEVEVSHRSGDEFLILISGQELALRSGEFEGVDKEEVNKISLVEYTLKKFQEEFAEEEKF